MTAVGERGGVAQPTVVIAVKAADPRSQPGPPGARP
jgi:hypothetical protein